MDIRKNRMSLIKEKDSTSYINLDEINKEVEISKKLFRKYSWPTVDITRKSVEETAASVIKIHNIMHG